MVAKQAFAVVYEETFAMRTSTSRDFADLYDRIPANSTVWDYSRDGDTLGPYSIVCSRAWSSVDVFGQPLTQTGGQWRATGGAMNGDSTLEGVYGNEFSIAGFWGPKPSGSAATTITLEAGGYEASVERNYFTAMPGGASSYRFPFYPDVVPFIVNGTLSVLSGDGNEVLLRFDNKAQVAAGNNPQPTVSVSISPDSGHMGDATGPGFVTASSPAAAIVFPVGGINKEGLSGPEDDDDPEVWPYATPYSVESNAKERPGSAYFSTDVAFRGRKVSVYRDGEHLDTLLNPTEAESLAVTSEDGSYLLVNEPSREADPAWTGEGRDDRRRSPRPFKSFHSFAKDTTPPIIGSSPPQDFYEDQGQILFSRPVDGFGWVNATKPVVLFGNTPATIGAYCYSDQPSDQAPRAYIAPYQFVLESDHEAPLLTQPAGTYTVRLSALEETPYCLFGVDAQSVPTFEVTVHPASTAPVPRLETVGLQTREYFRARLQSEKVSTVDLTFYGGRVFPDGVQASHITLTKDGNTVPGCTISRIANQLWRVSVPGSAQTPGAFFVLTYDPGGEVVEDAIRVERYDRYDKFPAAADSQYRVAYVDVAESKWYTKTPQGYAEIEPDSPPLQPNGEPYENEPVVCAARVSWLMAYETAWPKPQDVNPTKAVQIGAVSSIGLAEGQLQEQVGEFRLECERNAFVDNWGTNREATIVDGFSPNCPSDAPGDEVCSYFGLSTTIEPCQPRTLTCPAPNAVQRHWSAFRTSESVDSLTISMVTKEAISFRPPVWLSHTVAKSLYGRTLPQNLYGCVIPPGAIPQDPAPIPFLNGPPPSYVLESGVFFAHVGRRLDEIAGMQTSIPWEVVINLRQHILVRQTDGFGQITYLTETISDAIVLTKEDEDRLLDGQVVEYPYGIPSEESPFRLAYWWRISR